MTNMTGSLPDDAAEVAEKLRGFDTSAPSPARMWNYWVGGKDHFAADRAAAEEVQAAMPALPAIARAVRAMAGSACIAGWNSSAAASSSTSGPGCPRPTTPTMSRNGPLQSPV